MLRPSQQQKSAYRYQSEHSLGGAESGVTQNPSNHDQRILAPERLKSVWALRKESLYAPLLSSGRNGLVPTKAVRSPGALRLHPAFNDLNLSGWLINSDLQGKPQDVHEPILITRTGIILGGFAEWHAAVCAGQPEIDCTEFVLNDDEALQLIITLHWAQHIFKRYRHAVRYFGLFAPRAVNQMFDRIFSAIGYKRQPRPAPPRWAESLKKLTGRDPLLDRIGQRMSWVRSLAPQLSR